MSEKFMDLGPGQRNQVEEIMHVELSDVDFFSSESNPTRVCVEPTKKERHNTFFTPWTASLSCFHMQCMVTPRASYTTDSLSFSFPKRENKWSISFLHVFGNVGICGCNVSTLCFVGHFFKHSNGILSIRGKRERWRKPKKKIQKKYNNRRTCSSVTRRSRNVTHILTRDEARSFVRVDLFFSRSLGSSKGNVVGSCLFRAHVHPTSGSLGQLLAHGSQHRRRKDGRRGRIGSCFAQEGRAMDVRQADTDWLSQGLRCQHGCTCCEDRCRRKRSTCHGSLEETSFRKRCCKP